ncbi:amino acid adenylation domain-containing protein [Tumebacillus sp. BK434]|uniref:non-ribosomal peptide synthase/polyketide synthase n=1 Tax=Tumebacillus sp. BK434 TaxID=2512169 RepID=UPI0010ED643E|nr:non-ribosomal peptide synthase/polyketide synthase [Tumebacillus sp. BK434]TCP57969.1 amino acid adenylation domain-containing protein [Tumebacillus sp. BK434]
MTTQPELYAFPASFAQQRLWFLDQLSPGQALYNMPAALRLCGPLQTAALGAALQEIVRRHETLRTTFRLQDDELMQMVKSEQEHHLPLHDLTRLDESEREAQLIALVREAACLPFDLSAGPLFRTDLYQVQDEEHILLLNLHHIISDGWSMGVLVRELSALYGAFVDGKPSPLEELPFQYADYAHFQRDWMQGEALDEMIQFWKNELGLEPPALQLPTDHPRPPGPSVSGETIAFALPRELNEPLQALCQTEQATPFMVLAAVFQTLLYRYTGQTDLRIGTPVAGRDAEEVEPLIGFFVNNVVLRADLTGAPTFREVLQRVKKSALAAYEHQEVPFEKLVEELQPERDLSVSPLFQVLFVLQNTPLANLELKGLEWSLLDLHSGTAKFDLTLSMSETADGLRGELEYKTDLFERATMERMGGHFGNLLAAVLQDPSRPVSEVPFLSNAELEQLLVAFNSTDKDYPQEHGLHELFERQAERTPDSIALIDGETRLTYAELNASANAIASLLTAKGIAPGKLVGLYMNRSAALVAALLAVLKTGAAYVPLDPNYPAERVLFTLEDASVALLITETAHADRLQGHGCELLCLDAAEAELAAFNGAGNLPASSTPTDLAYVIYTSGSTGRPKGVAIEHHSAVTLVHWAHEAYAPDEYAGVLFSTSICFDLSIFELFVPLAGGGKVILAENALALPELPARDEVTLINTVPSAIAELHRMQAIPLSVRVINLAGEPLKGSLVQALYGVPTVEKVYNLYGPSEDTTYSTYALIERESQMQPLIGRPLPRTKAYVLSPELQPVPLGTPGELLLGGGGLARGYLNRPELTAEKFIPSPFAEGERLYRTGDLVRYLPDGSLDYLGRLDHQVKVRGFRIELGEIEAVLLAHPQVQEATVIVREDLPGDQRVVAYVVAAGEALPTASDLRTTVKQKLPDYMVPSAFLLLDALPLTPNGKIDRKALPAPDPAGATAEYIAPRTETETKLAALWSELLGADPIGLHDNFFSLGGHSLLATRMISRVRQQFGLDVPLSLLFEKPELGDFAQHLAGAAAAALPPIVKTQRGANDLLPLSDAQRRMWFLDQLLPGHPVYNMPGAVRLQGALDQQALEQSLQEILRRHDVLRATFHQADGSVQQQIGEPALILQQIDLSGVPSERREEQAHQTAAEEAARPFDLAQGPLLRTTLVKLAADDHLLLITFHHIVSDGWSIGLFVEEWMRLYAAFTNGQPSPLAELPLQYADYAQWQQEQLLPHVLPEQLAYWKQQLSGDLPLLQLPFDRPRPVVQTYAGRLHRFTLPAALTAKLHELSRQEGATLFMTLLAAFNTLLHRYSGQTDLLVGTPVAGRGAAELEALIGFFVNTLVVRTDASGNPAFRELLGRVKTAALGATAHADVPFEKLVEELQPARDMSHSPLFQAMFAMQNAPLPEFGLPGLTLRRLEVDSNTAKFDLTLFVEEQDGALNAVLEYNTDLFDAATIERMAGHFTQLLTAVTADPKRCIGELDMLGAEERALLLDEWNQHASGLPATTLVALVEAQAAKTPDRTALIAGDERLTYAGLNARANRLAHELRAQGVGPETLVGICLERTAELPVAILGVLKAGGAYVPLDPNYPADRIGYTLEDAMAAVLLTQASLADRLPQHPGQTWCLDAAELAEQIAAHPSSNPDSAVLPHHLAYVIYTSGSTGRPKGVAIEHHSAATMVQWAHSVYTPDEYAGTLFSTSVCFDLSIYELFVPLAGGGAVILADNALHLPELPARDEVTLINTVPSAIAELLRLSALPERAGVINLAGEPLKGALVQALYGVPTVQKVYNLYGPSEDTTYSTYALMERNTAHPLIGRPLTDTAAYVLSPQLQPVPIGVAGELFLGGAGLARGYLNQPELTAEKFIPNPFAASGHERLYRTGDLVRRLPDGSLDYIGRLDQQVKVRGFRIELGEIEAVLNALDLVQEAVVIVRTDLPSDPRIVAYWVAADREAQPSPADLQSAVQHKLPDYMVPSAFVALDALPLTPNGKVDKKALPAPEAGAQAQAYTAPRTATEAGVAAIWAEVLHAEQVGACDSFFERGGHSLLAAQVLARLRSQFGVELKLRDVFEHPTVERLAAHIDALAAEGAAQEAERLALQELQAARSQAAAVAEADELDVYQLPVSYAQRRMWLLDQLMPNSPVYNIPGAVRLTGQLNEAALELALGEIMHRHEVLRSSYLPVGEELQQIVALRAELPLSRVDLTGHPQAEREALALQLAAAEGSRPFTLAAGPLFRATLLRLDAADHLFLLTFHHIVSDGWSMGLFIREWAALYQAFASGQPSPLPELQIQYADLAHWQQERLAHGVLAAQLPYWKHALGGELPLLQLPTDAPRPSVQRYAGATYRFALPTELHAALQALSRREESTLFMTLLAAFKTLLHRYSGQDDLLVGTPVAGRTHQEIERSIGLFVNTLVLRTDVSGNPTFRELLGRVKETTLGAYSHDEVPFEKLVEELGAARDRSYTPFFQVMFALQSALLPDFELPELHVSRVEVDNGTAKFDLTLFVEERADGLCAALEYNTDLFTAATIERMAGHLLHLLTAIVQQPETTLGELPILSAPERHQLLTAWNDTASGSPQLTLSALVEAQAAQTPHRIALIDGETRLTYAELNERANRLAHLLQQKGIGAESLVGICLERTLELPVAILAVLKAGGAYVPLDPNYPAERILYTLEDANVALLLTEAKLLDRLHHHTGERLCLDQFGAALAAAQADNPHSDATPNSLAYVIYTSGSTGRPKGVAIEHHSASTLVHWARDVYTADEYAGVLFSTSVCFDLSIFELFVPLAWGGKVILAENALHLPLLPAKDEVTLINTVPSAIAELLRMEAIPTSARVINLAGEPLKGSLVQALYRVSTVEKVYNLYGPSEDTTYSTYALIEREATGHPLIGRPLADTQAYVLNPQLQPVPTGVAGELFLGGDGLARGYLNQPELTAEKFIQNPFDPSGTGRLYRTGDLVKYLPDGSLDYLGRLDHQVKVRGFRIELGEIEAVLSQHPQVAETTVIVREDLPGDQRITAYVVAVGDALPTVSELRRTVKHKLPEYMVPSAFVLLDALPLTPNGKIDKKALPAPAYTRDDAEQAFTAPRTPLEEQLAAIWSDLLGVQEVGAFDSFFALGGHSLLATQMISRVRHQFGIDLPLGVLFERPQLAEFAERIAVEADAADRQALLPPITAGPRDKALPLSYAQQRLWFLDQLDAGSSAYNLPTVVQLNGPLNRPALEATFQEIVRRHEALRTNLISVDGDGQQVIQADVHLPLPLRDLSGFSKAEQEAELKRMIAEEAERPFQLALDLLVRAALFKLEDEAHVLVLTMHHIVSDAWSMGVMLQEVTLLYEAFAAGHASPLPELSIQYADYALWQRQHLTGAVLDEQLSYWKQVFAGDLPLLELPTDRPRPPVQTYRGAVRPFTLSAGLTGKLLSFSQGEGSTLFMTLFAAFNTLLHRYSSQEDLIVGTPIANRRQAEVEALIGFFVNTLALRTDLTGNPTFRELLQRVKSSALGAYAHQDLPFEMLVDELKLERDMSRTPLFQVMFVLQNAPLSGLRAGELNLQPLELEANTAKFDLLLSMMETEQGMTAQFEYNTDLFDSATIDRMAAHFTALLETIVTSPDTEIGRLPFQSAAELDQLLHGFNETAKTYPDMNLPLHLLFEAQVERTPDAPALMFAGETLTYAELNARANQLAHHLRALGIRPDDKVGVCMERSFEMVIALYGILKAGGAYIPLDPTYPPERLAYLFEDSQADVLLTQSHLLSQLPPHSAQVLCLDTEWDQVALAAASNPEVNVTPDNLAYMIYTSGSTGNPKGAMIPHQGIVNRLLWMQEMYGLDATDRVLQKTPFSFDVSVWEFFWPLFTGACLVVALPEGHKDSAYLRDLISTARITTLHFVPSMLQVFLDETGLEELNSLRRVICSGEALPFDLQERFFSRLPLVELHNLYGPTEASVDVTYWACTQDSGRKSVPIGYPIANIRLYVLDRFLQPAPIGVAGELHIGGIGLARGYHNRAELTAEKFIPNPFGAGKLYKTGDLAKVMPDGVIEYLGRLDHQVKIRGFRIELGEIEAALNDHPHVREAVVLVREDQPGNKRVIAYAVATSDTPPTAGELRQSVKDRLPEYMVPSAIVLLDALPLTPNGKVDRKALPAPELSRDELSTAFVAPRNAVEEQLAAIWTELLGVQEIGVHDNFFTLGGHSLLATKLITRVRGQFQVEIGMRSLFGATTIAELAALIDHAVQEAAQTAAPTAATDAAPAPASGGSSGLTKRSRAGYRMKKEK